MEMTLEKEMTIFREISAKILSFLCSLYGVSQSSWLIGCDSNFYEKEEG
jgi:hypothetical protein